VLAALVLGVVPKGAAKPGEGVSSISAASYAAIDSESIWSDTSVLLDAAFRRVWL
jgi:hypothetical protein